MFAKAYEELKQKKYAFPSQVIQARTNNLEPPPGNRNS
jgi:hypothetical protein